MGLPVGHHFESYGTAFCFSSDSSLGRLDSSLHDSFSIELPINDPTGETLSTRYKREECDPFPKQGEKSHFCKEYTILWVDLE